MKLLIMGISLLTLIAGCADNKEGSPTPLVSTKSYGQEVLEKCREQKTNWRAAWETYQRAEEDFFACFETENLSQYDAIKCGSNISDYAPKDFLKEADSANYPLYGKKECQKVGVDISSVIEDTMDRIEYVKNITDDRKQEKKILVKYSDLRPSSVPFSYNQSTESYSFEFCDVMIPSLKREIEIIENRFKVSVLKFQHSTMRAYAYSAFKIKDEVIPRIKSKCEPEKLEANREAFEQLSNYASTIWEAFQETEPATIAKTACKVIRNGTRIIKNLAQDAKEEAQTTDALVQSFEDRIQLLKSANKGYKQESWDYGDLKWQRDQLNEYRDEMDKYRTQLDTRWLGDKCQNGIDQPDNKLLGELSFKSREVIEKHKYWLGKYQEKLKQREITLRQKESEEEKKLRRSCRQKVSKINDTILSIILNYAIRVRQKNVTEPWSKELEANYKRALKQRQSLQNECEQHVDPEFKQKLEKVKEIRRKELLP